MPDLSEREGKLCCPAPKCGAKVTATAFCLQPPLSVAVQMQASADSFLRRLAAGTGRDRSAAAGSGLRLPCSFP
jgi:hypothetical protein